MKLFTARTSVTTDGPRRLFGARRVPLYCLGVLPRGFLTSLDGRTDAGSLRESRRTMRGSPAFGRSPASFTASPYEFERLGLRPRLPTPSEHPQDRIEHGVEFLAHVLGKKAQHEVAVLL